MNALDHPRAGARLTRLRAAALGGAGLLAVCLIVVLPMQFPPSSKAAAAPITGQWTVEFTDRADTVHLTLQRRQGEHGFMNSSSNFRAADLKGLDRAKAGSGGAPVRFRIERDAGTLDCEGWFKENKGSGHFTFTANPTFVAEMGRLGYDQLSDEKVFALAVHDVSLRFIDELKALGYERVPLDDLLAMHIHGVTPDFIREMKGLGYADLAVDDLVAMRIHGVTADFVRALEALGYDAVPVDDLVAMRIHGATPEFAGELKALGYDRVPPDQLVAMRIHGVTAEFIKTMQSRGYASLSVDKLVSLRIHGIE